MVGCSWLYVLVLGWATSCLPEPEAQWGILVTRTSAVIEQLLNYTLQFCTVLLTMGYECFAVLYITLRFRNNNTFIVCINSLYNTILLDNLASAKFAKWCFLFEITKTNALSTCTTEYIELHCAVCTVHMSRKVLDM